METYRAFQTDYNAFFKNDDEENIEMTNRYNAIMSENQKNGIRKIRDILNQLDDESQLNFDFD